MKGSIATLLMPVVLVSVPALAQRAKRAPPKAQPENTRPVDVKYSATLRITIAGDSVGVFDYLANSQKLPQWFPDQAVLEPRIGGVYHFRWQDTEGIWSGVVTEFIRGNTLGLTWKPPGEDEQTNVTFKLSPQGPETVVELTHSGFASSESLDKAIKAWVFYLQNLKSVIEQGTDLRSETTQTPARPTTRTRRKQ
jgi:uncharacterized protein YndB with AHSA1/START domain